MKTIWLTVFIAICFSATTRGQLFPPNEAGVTMGHVHLTVHDMEGNKKFWALIGGTPTKIDGTDVVREGLCISC